MHFSYQEFFKARSPEAYETLLTDVMLGDATLFMRADQVEASWTALAPVLTAWENSVPGDFPNYRAGSWGPRTADALIARDGRTWLEPTPEEDLHGNGK
jgi:glucose-6-phosphate 1-dehydrogenase